MSIISKQMCFLNGLDEVDIICFGERMNDSWVRKGLE